MAYCYRCRKDHVLCVFGTWVSSVSCVKTGKLFEKNCDAIGGGADCWSKEPCIGWGQDRTNLFTAARGWQVGDAALCQITSDPCWVLVSKSRVGVCCFFGFNHWVILCSRSHFLKFPSSLWHLDCKNLELPVITKYFSFGRSGVEEDTMGQTANPGSLLKWPWTWCVLLIYVMWKCNVICV